LKNKTKIYVLLVIVLGVWGTIAYKILNGISPSVPQANKQELDIAFKPDKRTQMDTFSVTPVNRDPFLGVLTHNIQKVTSKKVEPKPKKSSLSISYSGMVSNQKASDKVFIVNIRSKQYLLKKGQTIDSVKLIKGDLDKIVVSYNNKSLTVKRQ
jgi:type II secretory pathway component PulC